MIFQPSFRVHVADPLGLVDMPFIITSAYTNRGGYPVGEWFLIVPENKKHPFAQRTRLNYKEFPAGTVSFDEEFLFNEMLNQAKLRLHQYILEQKGPEWFSLLAKRLDVLSSNQNLFVNLWLRGGYSECLESIHKKTECEPLADFLEWVCRLPKFTTQDL